MARHILDANEMPNNCDNIEKQIREAIHKVGVKCEGKSDGKWTTMLNDDLQQLGKEHNYRTCAPRCEEHGWLFDLCWYKEFSEGLANQPLVAEFEWQQHYKHIRYDFEKLMVARADHRLMVFQQPNNTEFDGVVEKLIKCIANFDGTAIGDRYLFACWLNDGSEKFIFRLHRVKKN